MEETEARRNEARGATREERAHVDDRSSSQTRRAGES
jgi:hypothetical protein